MRAILGYGISIMRDTQEYIDLMEVYPWLAIHEDDYINADAIMNDAIEEELETVIWYCEDVENGIFVAAKGSLHIKDEADYNSGEISLGEMENNEDSIISFCEVIGREPEWILLCVE